MLERSWSEPSECFSSCFSTSRFAHVRARSSSGLRAWRGSDPCARGGLPRRSALDTWVVRAHFITSQYSSLTTLAPMAMLPWTCFFFEVFFDGTALPLIWKVERRTEYFSRARFASAGVTQNHSVAPRDKRTAHAHAQGRATPSNQKRGFDRISQRRRPNVQSVFE